MKTIQGDLLDLAEQGYFDVIVHGCNCQCDMGGGIALQIKNRYPEAWQADVASAIDNTKLGAFTQAEIIRGSNRFIVVNAYTQLYPSGDGIMVDYNALQQCFITIANKFSTSKIGYPKIGAGLAKGDWTIIQPLIDKALAGLDHTLVVKA